MSDKRNPDFWMAVIFALLMQGQSLAQDKGNLPDKRVTTPVVKEPQQKQQESGKPPLTPKPPKSKGKTVKAYGIRPPANDSSGNSNNDEKKPSAKLGIRPPANDGENKAGDKPENKPETKVADKPKKSSSEEVATKKTKAPKKATNKAQPAAQPAVSEPAPTAVAPEPVRKAVVMTGPADDPKFGANGKVSAVRRDVETGFLNRSVTVGNAAYRYQVFVPRNWTPRQTWPVILFLHGAGERGDDGFMQTDIGLASAIRRDAARFPAIVVMPQCRKNGFWTEESMQALALAALEQSIREFNGDRARLYLTGLSMGGYGTWGLAAQHAGKFAAYVAVCGGLKTRDGRTMINIKANDNMGDPYAVVARLIGQTPTWIFHGGDDKTVLPEESRKMRDALKAAGGNVQYTEYPGVAHNSWDKAYAEPKLMEWLLAQRLKR